MTSGKHRFFAATKIAAMAWLVWYAWKVPASALAAPAGR